MHITTVVVTKRPLCVVALSTLPMLQTTFLTILLSRYSAIFYKKAASESRDDLLHSLVTEESPIRHSDGFHSSGFRMRAHPRITDGPRRRGVMRGGNIRINQRVISTHGDHLGSVAHLRIGNARWVLIVLTPALRVKNILEPFKLKGNVEFPTTSSTGMALVIRQYDMFAFKRTLIHTGLYTHWSLLTVVVDHYHANQDVEFSISRRYFLALKYGWNRTHPRLNPLQ